MTYVDGFVIPIKKDQLEAYRQIAEKACKVWMEHGALEYKECVIDDDNIHGTRPFAQAADSQQSEIVIFAYIVYQSRAHRDEVNAKVMADPRINEQGPETMPFDCKRMVCAGFKTIIEA